MLRPVVVLAYSTAAVALAAQWIAAKIALRTVTPLELSTVRFAVASVVFLAVVLIWRIPLPLRHWRQLTLAAALGFLGFNTLAFLGLRLTPVSDSALIVPTTIPVATAIFATLIRERLTATKLAGFAIASLGAAVVIVGGQQASAEISLSRLTGDLLELASALSWAACLTVSAVILRTEELVGSVTFMSLAGTALLFPLGFFESGYRDLTEWSGEAWSAAIFLGVVSTFFAFLIFFWAVRRFGAGLGAMISYLAPIAALVLAFLILGERPLPLQLVGAAIIVVGVRVASLRPATAAPGPASP